VRLRCITQPWHSRALSLSLSLSLALALSLGVWVAAVLPSPRAEAGWRLDGDWTAAGWRLDGDGSSLDGGRLQALSKDAGAARRRARHRLSLPERQPWTRPSDD
jgi:hypothetical protein